MKYTKIILAILFTSGCFISALAQPFPPSGEHRLKHLKKVLQLTDEQSEKVKTIFKSTDEKLNALQNKSEMEHEQEMEALDKIFTSQNAEIDKLLTDTQKKKYAKMKENMEARGPEGFGPPPPMDGPDGMPPGPPDDGFGPPFNE